MTAILLDIVFTLALARAFSISLSELLNTPCGGDSSPVFGPTDVGESRIGNGTLLQGSAAERKEGLYRGLSDRENEVAKLVDAFSMTYNAAYRCRYLSNGML